MSDLNNIELDSFLIAGLYKSSIVELDVKEKKDPEPGGLKLSLSKEPDWESLGGNKKQILFLVSTPGVKILSDKNRKFLDGILTACKLELADLTLINLLKVPDAGYKELNAYFKPRIIFLMGIDPVDFGLPISFPQFQIQPFANASFLCAPSLDDLENDKVLKSRLWVCLRRIFNL